MVTVSIGVFGGRLESGDSWDMLIAAADRALYQAKENGRNRVEVATGLRRPSAMEWVRMGVKSAQIRSSAHPLQTVLAKAG